VIYLHDVVDPSELSVAIAAGYVSATDHPTLDLRILNYTHRCQYDRAWNAATRACRGLIYRPSTGELVARPWPKFFNYGEHEEGSLDLDAPAEVTDKMDGSLGILYPAEPGGYAVATRGSFTSEQALRATTLLAGEVDFLPSLGLTYLFEIIYPGNRVVCDYGEMEDLVFLGAVETATGLLYGPGSHLNWPGPRASLLSAETLGEALAMEPRENAEGIVARFDDGTLVKIKQEDYVALHRIITGLNERTVWEHLGAGGTVGDLCEPIPEEFHPWVEDVAARLFADRDAILANTHSTHARIAYAKTRKDYALLALEHPEIKSYLFMLLDGKDPIPAIWRTLRPSGERPLVQVDEATA
jgi:RNA ligase